MGERSRRVASAVTGLVVLASAAGACNDGGDASDPGPAAAETTTSRPAVTTDVALGRVTGRLPREAGRRLAHQVGGVVDGWFDAAYIGGRYPRRAFGDSWPGFTAGAREQARRDGDLTSNRDIGDRIDGVEAKQRRVRVDVLAVRQRPVGVTAHVRLRFAAIGGAARTVRVAGRLYLTRGPQGWRVFGYDLTKGDAR